MWVIILVIALIVLCYFKLTKINKYWEERAIPYLKPWPFVGNMLSNLLQQRAFPHLTEDFYYAYQDNRYVGIYQFLQPVLMIRDPDLIRTITVKEFSSFPDHTIFKASEDDDLSNKTLFGLNSSNGWHEMRATLSPSFTSSKLRSMFVLMEQCADQFTTYLQKQGGTVTLDIKDAVSRYTNDVIGTTAFGVTYNSLENPKNDFYRMGKELTDFTGLRSLVFFGSTISPKLMKLLKFKIFSETATKFFGKVIKETIRVREEKQIVRPDMIHLLMEARKSGAKQDDHSDVVDSGFAVVHESGIEKAAKKQKIEITDDDILALATGFFFAGFDTSSTLLSYASYELAVNPDIQEKLRNEGDSSLKGCNGKITYETLLGMKYLDAVVTETLRKWPPAVITDRTSIKRFTIGPERPGETQVHLESGTVCWIPIFAIQRDPKYYPDPKKFDPERFSDENKHKIKPFTYLPFGIGPRSCIGSRFALLETKLLLVKLLEKFEVVPTQKTPIPLEFSKKESNLMPDGGIWLELKPRTST